MVYLAPYSVARPPDISRSELTPANLEKSKEIKWVHDEEPLADFSVMAGILLLSFCEHCDIIDNNAMYYRNEATMGCTRDAV